MEDTRRGRRGQAQIDSAETSAQPGCIDVDELVAMIEGRLSAGRVDAVLAHVDACPRCAEVIANLGAIDEAARRVGRYELEKVLGSGGMGIVYAAWDPELQRRVAVKLVRPERTDDAARVRMLRESRALAKISHPNVVAVYDVGEDKGDVYVATELVDGETLATWHLGRPPREIVGAWIQVARGLAAAHAVGVVHRDVKPANALVGRDGRVRIGDFGLARQSADALDTAPARPGFDAAVGPQVTVTGSFSGTPAYMAPEQRLGSASARSDQFALCVAVVEALTGQRPAADAAPTLAPAALAQALARGLRRDPDARFPTMDQLADALAAAVSPPPPRLRRTALIAAAVGALTTGTVVAWTATRARCRVATVPADLWSPARRERLDRTLPGHVASRIDAWLAAWTAASGDVCTTDRDARALRVRRQRCLDDALEKLRRQLDRWQSDPPQDGMTVHDALDQVPHPARCSHAAVLATTDPTPEQRARIEPLRERMLATRREGTVASASELAELARGIGHPPFAVEAMLELAGHQAQLDNATATRTVRAALMLADQAGDDYSRVTAATQLISLLGADRADEAEKLAEDARVRIAALGGDPVLEGTLDFNLGTVWRTKHRHDEAIAAFERARRAFRAAYGPDPPHEAVVLVALSGVFFDRDPDGARARATFETAARMFHRAGIPMPSAAPRSPAELIEQTTQLLARATATGPNSQAVVDATYNLAIAYALADQPERALEHYQKAAALGERLGQREAKLANALAQSAMILVELHRPREAIPVARRAVALAEALAVDVELGSALTVLGSALLETGQAAAAREPLRRALAIRDRLHESGRFRGNTRFLLATALWDVNRRRARDLARAARVDIQSFIDELPPDDPNTPHLDRTQRARLAQIDAWLRHHR